MGDLRDDILEAVADREGTDVSELPTLYDYVEVDGLKSMVEHADEMDAAEVSVTFDYAGYEVHVDDTGAVSVED